jgi:hypothetical protein
MIWDFDQIWPARNIDHILGLPCPSLLISVDEDKNIENVSGGSRKIPQAKISIKIFEIAGENVICFKFKETEQKPFGVKCDGFVKSRRNPQNVIPAKAGIQCFKLLIPILDPGLHRDDDFLRVRRLFDVRRNLLPGLVRIAKIGQKV